MKRLAIILGVLFFISCSKNEPADQPFMELSAVDFLYTSESATQKLELNTNLPWKVVVKYEGEQEGWITLSNNGSGEGKHSVSVTVTENNSYEDRTAKLMFEAGEVSTVVKITQKRKSVILLSQDSYEMEEMGGIIDVRLKSSVDFSIVIPETSASWITPVALRSLEESTHRFQISQSNVTREGLIVFKEKTSQLADTVRIYQTGKNDLLKDQKAALMSIFNATSGPNWSDKTNWGSDLGVEQWNGVYVDEDGYVVRLRLNNRGLKGTLPDVFGDLKRLTKLELNGNMLNGKLPSSLLEHNSFDLFALTLIRQANGYGFDLTGVHYSIPSFNSTNLEGNQVNSETLYSKNKITALFLFNTKVPASVALYPEICLLSQTYKSKGFEVVGFSRENENTLREYISNETIALTESIRNCISSTYFTDNLLITKGAPYIVLVNSEGKVIGEFDNDLTGMKQLLKNELGEPAPAAYYTSTDFSMDGQVVKLQSATTGNGIDIVFLGDGFVDKELVNGGKWDKAANDAMRHFFSVEPAKSYRDHFNVYAIKKVSQNNLFRSDCKTAFDVEFGEGTYIEGNFEKCFDAIQKANVGIDIPNSSITVILNSRKYAGYTYWWYGDGKSVAFVPMPNVRDNPDEEFREIFIHETIGHGFARLFDEYTTNSGMIPNSEREKLADAHTYGFGLNVTTSQQFVPWRHFFGLPGYEMVGLFEGGFLYQQGVWRAEANQSMNNNVPYFNAPSRELFVKRLKQITGEQYTFADFQAKDKYEPVTKGRSFSPIQSTPLAPPRVMDRKK